MKRISCGCMLLAIVLPLLGGTPLLAQTERVKVELVGQVDTGESTTGVTLSGNYAYVVDWWAGLQVIDISNPTSPQRVGGYDIPGGDDEIRAVAVSGAYAYLVGRLYEGTNFIGILEVIDISNPADPQRVAGCNIDSYPFSVAVSSNHAYVADWDAGLRVIDISNPADPQRVGCIDTGHAVEVVISGNYAYVANVNSCDESDHSSLQVVDITTPSNPQQVVGIALSWTCPLGGPKLSVAVSGNYAYVVDRQLGLKVIDISNPSSPQPVGGCVTSYGYVAISGSYAYVGNWEVGLQVIDVSSPTNPQQVGDCDTGVWDTGVWGTKVVSSNYVYVATDVAGLQIYKITELPAITRHSIENGRLNLQWNDPAKGMTLQRTPSLTKPDWQPLMGSESTNAVSLPIAEGSEFFRLMKPIEVLYGPLTNATNGHLYYLLTEGTWTASEARAIQLGGHLATINDEAENQWVFDTFSGYGGVGRGLWIGLTDEAVEGEFRWVDGTPVSFQRWAPGEPNNHEGAEDWVHIFYPQDTAMRAPGWNDAPNVNTADRSVIDWIPLNGVVEVR